MKISKRRVLVALLAGAAVLLHACGGGDDHWDEYRPRTATVQDLENQSFVFRDFSYGAVFDASLATTTTTLAFLAAQPSDAHFNLPFSVSARSASSSGMATLNGSTLVLEFTQVDGSLPFSTGRNLTMDVSADVDDGRIQLRNTETGLMLASAPR